MTKTPSRHARMTSLVGTLLMAAVAGCLVAFSLVAQHAAQQSPGAPAVRPVTPRDGSGPPIDVAPFAKLAEPVDDSPTAGASPDAQIDALLARADEPAPAARREPSRGSAFGTPEVGRDNFPDRPSHPQKGPKDPDRCEKARCHEPRPKVPAGGGTEETCRGKGHLKHAGRHNGRGKGHCEHEGETTPTPPEDPGSDHGNKPDHAGPPADKGNSDKAKAPKEKSDRPAKSNGQGHEKPQGPPAKGSHGKPPKSEPPGQAKKEDPSASPGKSSAPGQSKDKPKGGKSK